MCSGNWKAHLVGTLGFPSFFKNNKKKIDLIKRRLLLERQPQSVMLKRELIDEADSVFKREHPAVDPKDKSQRPSKKQKVVPPAPALIQAKGSSPRDATPAPSTASRPPPSLSTATPSFALRTLI